MSAIVKVRFDMRFLQDPDLKTSFRHEILSRGLDYFHAGYVQAVHEESNDTVTATVKGSEAEPYQVRLTFSADQRPTIRTTCSCPYGSQCKHGAAVAYDLRGRWPQEVPKIEFLAPLPYEIETWLRSVDNYSSDPLYLPEGATSKVTYSLVVRPDRLSAAQLMVVVSNKRILKSGALGIGSDFKIQSVRSGQVARHVNAYDLELIKDLLANCEAESYDRPRFYLKGKHGARLLNAIVESGRCYWSDSLETPFRRAAARRGSLTWTADKRGQQTANVTLEPNGMAVRVDPPAYVDPQRAEYGEILSDIPSTLFLRLMSSPSIAPEHGEAVRGRLEAMGVPEASRPIEPIPIERITVPPVIHVRAEIRLCDSAAYGWRATKIAVPFARVTFDYGGREVVPSDREEIRTAFKDRIQIFVRDLNLEQAAIDRVAELGWSWAQYSYSVVIPKGMGTSFYMAPHGTEDVTHLVQFETFITEEAPRLEEAGWVIHFDKGLRYAKPEEVNWEVGIDSEPGSDWFEFKLGIKVGEAVLDLRTILPQLLSRKGDPKLSKPRYWGETIQKLPSSIMVTLADGTIVTLPGERVRALVAPLEQIFGPWWGWSDELKLSKARLTEAETVHPGGETQWRSTEELESLRQKLSSFDRLSPEMEPPGFEGELREYQKLGLAWLQFLAENGFSGLLADDMGLGKTVQVLANVQAHKNTGRMDRPCLVVCPTSTLPNWRIEAKRFTPDLRVISLHGQGRALDYNALENADLALTTYAILARDQAKLSAREFHLVILDEAQNIKNASTKTAIAARSLKARHRLCLSGTPVENHLEELWSLFQFLMPSLLGSQQQFRSEFRRKIEQSGDPVVRERLARRVKPFMLRRTKEQVVKELPPKTEIVEMVELGDKQRDLYETLRISMDKKVRELLASQGLDRSRIQILDALLKLRQACCDPRLVKVDSAREVDQSAKLERLAEMIEVLVEDGRKILLFSQFTSMLDLIEERLRPSGIQWVRISGETTDRSTPVERFQAGEVPLFLISLRAGGTGLNLVAADTVIHYDPWWNPAVERQASDRAYRIGQTNPVSVYRLVAAGTVEEKMLELQKKKQDLADSILSDTELASILNQDDLAWLFER